MTLDDDYVELTNLVSVKNDTPARMMFFSLMGAHLKDNVRIAFGDKGKDTRLSFIWLQPSRTGKGQTMKVAEDIATEIGLTWVENTDFSTAGLIGSPDETKKEFNIKHNLTPENQFSDDGQYCYQEPVNYGDIQTNDIIFVPEAKKAFASRYYSEDLLTDLQPTLDFPGHVRKRLRAAAIEYTCSPTFILTTYNYYGLSRAITEQGFFQRCQFLTRNFSVQDIKDMRKEQDNLLGINTQYKYARLKNRIVKQIKRIDTETPIILTVSKSALKMKQRLITLFLNRIEKEITGEKFGVAMSFSQTMDDIILKTGAIRCIWRGGNQIESYDIIPSTQNIQDWVYFNIASSVIQGLSLDEKTINFQMKRALTLYKSTSRKIKCTDYQLLLMKSMDISYDKARTLTNSLLDQNMLKIEKGVKNTKYLVLP